MNECKRCGASILDQRGVAHGKRYALGSETVWLCYPCYLDVTSRRTMPPRHRLQAEGIQGRMFDE